MSRTPSLFEEEKLDTVQVAIPLPVADPFTYAVSLELKSQARVGTRVRVPFKNRTLIGYVTHAGSDCQFERPKKILEVLDQEPVLSDHQLRLAKWISEYYFSSWGEAISNLLPKYLNRGSRAAKSQAAKTAPPRVPEEPSRSEPFRLNDEQEAALRSIRGAIERKAYAPIFIFGVTGGGKSEVYIRAIKEVLDRGKSAVCLVPEIALTEQLKLFFAHHFHDRLEILHSKFTDRERYEAWSRIQKGLKSVILGARSAVFAPARNLGLIIMDEEQEGSYKQDQTPRYHAREAADWRARDLGIPFIMGTATPTLETMHRVRAREIEMVSLTKRIDARPMPEVKVIDLKETMNQSKYSSIISVPLRQAIEKSLGLKKGILIMLNRRGFSTVIRCTACRTALDCPFCAVSLTYHQNEREIMCHYCNYHAVVPDQCPQCGQALLKYLGFGTEKVESELGRLFPNARIGRLDRDTTKKRGEHERILAQFRTHELDILVGTQMIAKGFDFQHVTLVGIVNADTGLLLPDFRSAERTFQLLAQMAGRTGRGKEPGIVYVQSHSPDHYSIRFAARHEYLGFFEEELKRRQPLNYPPFSKLINVVLRGKKEKLVELQARELGDCLKRCLEGGCEILGPAPLALYRLRGHFRWHLMLRGSDASELRSTLKKALLEIKKKREVFISVDVDPIMVL